MSSGEEKQILKMVEAGKISADEAMNLIKALDAAPAEDEIEVTEPEAASGRSPELVEGPEFVQRNRPSTGSGLGGGTDPEFEEVKARARRFASVPLGIGILLTVLASYWLFLLVRDANYGFWFVCAWFPLLMGILLIALSAGGMNARWLYLNVDQKPGERPQHITLGFPIPMDFLGWLLRTFGAFVPGMDRQRVDEVMSLLAAADAHGPLIVNVNESERGDRVQVYIG
jgi:hypothetical protein